MSSTTRGVVVTSAGNAIPPIAALATQPLLAHGLSVSERGEVAAATAPLLFAVATLTLGVPESLTYFAAKRAVNLSALVKWSYCTLILAGFAGSAVIVGLSGVLSGESPRLARLIIIAALALTPSLLVTGLRGLAIGHERWERRALEMCLGSLARLAGIASLYVTGKMTPYSATIAIATATFLGGIVYLVPGGRTSAGDRDASLMAAPREVKTFAARVWVGALAGTMLLRADQLLITPLSNTYELGIYAVSVSLSETILIFNSAVRDVMFSVESGDPNERRVAQSSRISTLVTLTAGALLCVTSPILIPILFGKAFAPAIPVTLVVVAAIVLGNPGSIAGVALSARGRPGLRSRSLAISAALNVIAVMLIVPHFGAIGAAFAYALGTVSAAALNLAWLRRYFGSRTSAYWRIEVADVKYLVRTAHGIIGGAGNVVRARGSR